jgi:pimeloyl-ACP methyl ester carboxylesterase
MIVPQRERDMQTIKTDILEVAYEAGGPRGGPPILLLHGWPDDIREWSAITPHLEKAGFYWVAPWVRGFGATRFLSSSTLRDGSGVALTQDAIDIADALGFERFSVIGHDWGARTAYTLAALWPERVASITACSLSYSPGGRFATPTFEQSQRWWYQWFMSTEPGAAAVRAIQSALPVINGHHGVHPAGSATLNSKRPRKASRIPIGPPSRSTPIGVAGGQSPRMSDTSH